MKHKSIFFVLPTCLLVGCGSSRSVVCVAPVGQFKPQSESELLSNLNSQLPFKIPQKYFISKQKFERLVGWAVVQNDEEKDIVKAALKDSATLEVLQVEALTPEFEAVIKRSKK